MFLDTLRLSAALTVLVLHGKDQWFPSQAHQAHLPGNMAHAAVVVFFVLSGYVIAHTTQGNDRGPVQYAVARLSRLASMVIPALLMTAVCELLVMQLDPALSAQNTRGFTLIRYIISGAFINELWFFSAAPPINGPLWSLSFEFWYYLIFGLWFYRTNRSGRGWIPVVLGCLVAGPKILLMMPIWLSGCMAYRLRKPRLSARFAWIAVACSMGAALVAIGTVPPYPYAIGAEQFLFANQFITDWVIGFFVACALWFLPAGRAEGKSGAYARRVRLVRKAADLTFPIYVLHFPLLVLYRGIFATRNDDPVQLGMALGSTLILCVLFGLVLEKQRFLWTALFTRMLTALRGRLGRTAAAWLPQTRTT